MIISEKENKPRLTDLRKVVSLQATNIYHVCVRKLLLLNDFLFFGGGEVKKNTEE